MKRRNFILTLAQASAGLFFSNYILNSCTSKEDLETILGKDISILKNYTVEFIGELSCFSLDNFNSFLEGDKAIIFTKKNKIVGYSVKFTNPKEVLKLSAINNKKIDFDNQFGKREVWENENIYRSITIPKEYEKLKQIYFFSEYLNEAKNFIW